MHDVLFAHGHAARGDQHIRASCRFLQQPGHGFGLVRGAVQHRSLSAQLSQTRRQHRAVRVVNLPVGQRLPGLHQLVPGGQQHRTNPAVHRHPGHAQAGQHADVRGGDSLAPMQHTVAQGHILPGIAHILPVPHGAENPHGVHALVGVLLAHHAVALRRHGRAGHHPQRAALWHMEALGAARAGFAHHGQPGGAFGGRGGNVAAVQAVAVQGRTVKGRGLHRGKHILRRHPSKGCG